jgi:predicted dehydrogenase
MKLNFGLVGLGNIGSRHFQVLNSLPEANIVAVCDSNKKLLNSFDLKNGYKETDYLQFLTHPEMELVSICTPHHLHAEMAIAALKAGKHVLVEKPMCLHLKEAQQMIAASKKYQRLLMVVKQNRYNPPVMAVQKLLEKNKLGKILDIQCNVWWNRRNDYYKKSDWRGKKASECGALYTQASHFIDLLVWWFGEIKQAKTVLKTLTHDIETEDLGHSIVQFANGATGNINWTTTIYEKNYEGSVTIIGEKGTVKIGGAYLNELEYWNVKGIPAPVFENAVTKPNIYKSNYQGSSSNHDILLQAVIDLVVHGKKNKIVEGEEALLTVKSIIKMYKG